MTSKRQVLIVSDLHCGSHFGLTPPRWQHKADSAKYQKLQAITWEWWCKEIKRAGNIDLVICNGDAIDGTGYRSGGTEQITTDRQEQVEIAIECLSKIKAKKFHFTYGTPYHNGDAEDYELSIAKSFDAKIGGHEWVQVGGVVFDCKHTIGGSVVPHARYTALGREDLWAGLWNELGASPKANIIVRSHVHYHVF